MKKQVPNKKKPEKRRKENGKAEILAEYGGGK